MMKTKTTLLAAVTVPPLPAAIGAHGANVRIACDNGVDIRWGDFYFASAHWVDPLRRTSPGPRSRSTALSCSRGCIRSR